MPAYNPCEPCEGCLPARIGDDMFYQAALNALCGIITAIEAGGLETNVDLVKVGGTAITLGQKAMAASIPVVVASDQSNLPTNITQVAGAAIAQGHGVAATAIRVELPTDGTGVVGLAAGAATVGSIASITTSVTPGTAAGNLGKAEDAVAASGDTGVAMLAVQTATPASTAADGDYGWLKTDALGKLWTAGNHTEDAAAASGDIGVFALGVRNDNAATTFAGTDGDYSGVAVDSTGRVFINPGVAATSLGKAEDAGHTTGDTGVMALAVRNDSLAVMSGTDLDYTPMSCNNRGVVHCDLITGTTSAWTAEDVASSDGGTLFTAGFVREDIPASNTSASGDYTWAKVSNIGYQYVDPVLRAAPSHTQPSVTTSNSFTIINSNTARRYFIVQNNSAANIMISLDGSTLTGIVPTSTNKGLVLIPGSSYESPPNYCSNANIVAYQTSGGTINTISCVEG